MASVATAPCRWRAALADGAASQGGDWHGGRLLLRSARVGSVRSASLAMAGLRGGAVCRWEGDVCQVLDVGAGSLRWRMPFADTAL